MLRTNIMSSLYRSPNWISAGGYIALGASPPTSGAIRVDAASYGNDVLSFKNGTNTGKISATPSVLYFGTGAANDLTFYTSGASSITVKPVSSTNSTLKFEQVTAQIIGGSSNGLAIRNSANTRDNFSVNDAGTLVLLYDGTYTLRMSVAGASGEWAAGTRFTSGVHNSVFTASSDGATGNKAIIGYYNQTTNLSALEVANVASGFGTLALMKSGGAVVIGTDPTGASYLLRVGGAALINSDLVIGNANGFYWSGLSQVRSPSDGVIRLSNNAGTDFGRLQFGGTTASFPAIKRSGNALVVGLADDSAKTSMQMSFLTLNNSSVITDTADGTIRLTNGAATAFTALAYGPAASAASAYKIQKKITGIADNTFTDVFTVTIPNAAHAATIEVCLSGAKGAGDAEGACGSVSSTVYLISIQRTAGVTTTAAISAVSPTVATTIAAGNAVATTAQCSAMTGAVGAQQTFTIQVKIARAAGASTNHTCTAVAELINSNATGITIA